MRKPACAELAELRSAYVDGALGNEDRETLLSHLVGCQSCRDDIAEVRSVRLFLNLAGGEAAQAPADLSTRLISIAGTGSAAPLWIRPFRRTTYAAASAGATLPSQRRRVRARIAAVSVAMSAAVGAASVVGYAAAPREPLAAIGDPIGDAQKAFSSALEQLPLSGEALGAVLVAGPSGLSTSTSATTGAPASAAGAVLSRIEVEQAMRRAAESAASVSYSGRQSFFSFGDRGVVTAQVAVVQVAGQGSQVQVLSRGGAEVLRGFTPATVSSRVVDDDLFALLERNYTLSGVSGAAVAGRSAISVAASRGGVTAARWWLDAQTGLVLWYETYDGAGRPALSYGFTSLEVTDDASIIPHLAPRLAVSRTTTAWSLTNVDQLSASGWFCQGELANLKLVRVRSDGDVDPQRLHLVFTDGVVTLTVVERRGRLTAPTDADWDAALGAYVRSGASAAASWQSGQQVFTVVTNGSTGVLGQAVGSLPHEPPVEATTMGDIKAGWARILSWVKG